MKVSNKFPKRYIELGVDGCLRLNRIKSFHSIFKENGGNSLQMYPSDSIILFTENSDIVSKKEEFISKCSDSFYHLRPDSIFISTDGKKLGGFRPDFFKNIGMYSDGSKTWIEFMDRVKKLDEDEPRRVLNAYAFLSDIKINVAINRYDEVISMFDRLGGKNANFFDESFKSVSVKHIREISKIYGIDTHVSANDKCIGVLKFIYKSSIELTVLSYMLFVEAVIIADSFNESKNIIIPNRHIFDFLTYVFPVNGLSYYLIEEIVRSNIYLKKRDKIPHRFIIMDVDKNCMEDYDSGNYKIKEEMIFDEKYEIKSIDATPSTPREKMASPFLDSFWIELN